MGPGAPATTYPQTFLVVVPLLFPLTPVQKNFRPFGRIFMKNYLEKIEIGLT
jgi:hypothetical protein